MKRQVINIWSTMNQDIKTVRMVQDWTRSLESSLVATSENVDWKFLLNFFPKLRERLSGNIQEMGQDGLSSVRGGKFIRPTSCWLHCDPCNICVRENQMCSSDISGRCTWRAIESTRGRIHPLCFQKHLLYIHYFTRNNSPHHLPFTEPKWPIFCISCCFYKSHVKNL